MIVQVAMVDDEKAARDYISSMHIWHMGEYALAFCAGSAEELMAYLKGTAVDILLMDVSMPETDGVSLSAKLKELYPQIDVVAISNYDDYDYVRQILKNGAKDYLLKHRLTEESLLAVLDRLAENRRNPDEGGIGRLSQQLDRFLQGDAAWPFARDGAIAVPCFGTMPALREMPKEQRKRVCRSVEHILTENHEPDMRRAAAAYGGTKFLLLLRFYDVLSRAAMEKRAAYICIQAQDAVRSLFQDSLTMSVGPILADQTTLPDYILERIRRDEKPSAARKKQLTLDQRTLIMNLLIQDRPEQLHNALKTVLDGAREEPFTSRYLTIRALTDILRETAAEWRLTIPLPSEGSALPAWIQAQSPDGLEKTILGLFDETLEKRREESLAGYSEPIREALSILKKEYAQRLTLAGLAGRIGVSEAYLSRLFHKELHCSFSGYLTGLRMERAKELMLRGVPIKTVSMETGYVQYTHFLRVFKQTVGMTPGAVCESKQNQIVICQKQIEFDQLRDLFSEYNRRIQMKKRRSLRMKRFLALLLTIALLIPAAALAEFPLTTENNTFTVFGQRDQNQAAWKDIYVLNEYEKMTGVHMEWQEVPSQGFDENKALLFASNELPDLFIRAFIGSNGILEYGVNSQQLIPLNDLIEQYAPNFCALMEAYPAIRQAITASDGNIYALPAIDVADTGLTSYKQWINKEWLAALNLEMPTTTEELKAVLIAFRDGDPNGNGVADEIPLGFREPSTVYEFGGSFGLQHNLRDTYNLNEDGTIHNWLCDDEFKEYITFLNELYTEKLLWQEYYLNDRPAWRSNLANALFGAFGMPYSDVFINVESQFTALPPVVGPHGDQIWSATTSVVNTVGSFAISYTCEHPELAVQWVDYFYSKEGSLFFRYGVEGVTYYLDEEGKPHINDDILNAEEGFMTALGKINLVPGGGFPLMIDNQTDAIVASELTKEVAAVFVPYLPKVNLMKPTLSLEAADRANAIEQDLNTYRDTSVTKFILGEWNIEEKWDEYVKTMEQLGIRELEALYQEALNNAD